MKAILFQIGDYQFISNLDYVFKITDRGEVLLNEGRIIYQDYNFTDLTMEVRDIIGSDYEWDYIILFANDCEQAGLGIGQAGEVIEAEAKNFYPLAEDFFKDNRIIFKQYYYDNSNNYRAIVFDFDLIKKVRRGEDNK